MTNTNWNEMFTFFQITDYYNYIELMERNIETHKSSVIEQFEEQSKHITDPEEKQDFYEFSFFDDYYVLDKSYTIILRKSLFITLYSFMEAELQKIARKVEKHNLTNIKINDISHRGIHQYHFYLETVHNIEIDIAQNEANRLLSYNTLRNYFVHNDDTLFKKDTYSKINSLQGVSFEEYPRKNNQTFYSIDSLDIEFNLNYLDLISLYFKELYIGLEKKDIKL